MNGIQVVIVFNIFNFICILEFVQMFLCWKGTNKYNFSFVQMQDQVIHVRACFLTSKINLSNDNLWE